MMALYNAIGRCQILLVTNFARVIETFLSPTGPFNEKLMGK